MADRLTTAQKVTLKTALVTDGNGFYGALTPPTLPLVVNSVTTDNPNGTLADMDGIRDILNVRQAGVGFTVSENLVFGRQIMGMLDLTELDAMTVGQIGWVQFMLQGETDGKPIDVSVGLTFRADLLAFFSVARFPNSRSNIIAGLSRDASEFENVLQLANAVATRGDVAFIWKDG